MKRFIFALLLFAHLSAIDLSSYTVYTLEPHGKFYIDNPNDCLKSRIVAGIHDEPDVLDAILCRVLPGMTILDIGAHIGTFSVPIAKKLNGTGTLYAFEPQFKLFEELTCNLELNGCENTHTLNVALGEKNGQVHMSRPIANNEGAGYIGRGGPVVQMCTLDSLDLGKIDLIKIDIENAEYNFLLGAKQTLLRDRPTIIMEIGGNRLKRAFDRIGPHKHHNRVLQIMHDLGYTGENLAWKNYIFTPKKDPL